MKILLACFVLAKEKHVCSNFRCWEATCFPNSTPLLTIKHPHAKSQPGLLEPLNLSQGLGYRVYGFRMKATFDISHRV